MQKILRGSVPRAQSFSARYAHQLPVVYIALQKRFPLPLHLFWHPWPALQGLKGLSNNLEDLKSPI